MLKHRVRTTAAVAVFLGCLAASGLASADDRYKITYSGDNTSGYAYVFGTDDGNGVVNLTSGTLYSDTLGIEQLVAPGTGTVENPHGDVLPYDNKLYIPPQGPNSPDGAYVDNAFGLTFEPGANTNEDINFYANSNGRSNDHSVYYFAGYDRDQGSLDSFTVQLDPEVSAAPEPGTWALLFAGVAMLGAVLRYGRRRENASVAA